MDSVVYKYLRKSAAFLAMIFGMLLWTDLGMAAREGFSGDDKGALAMKRSESSSKLALEQLRLVVTYDNHPFKEGLVASWGFSCLITGGEKTILFDTGGRGSILSANMKALGIDPQEIDVIVLSHIHGDHVGGVASVLQGKTGIVVYLPASFPQRFKRGLRSHGAKIVEVRGPTRICAGVHSTGELGNWLKEQSLVIDTHKGIMVITGCAHPGIVRIIDKAKRLTGAEVLLVMGGFHLAGEPREEIDGIIHDFRQMGVKYVGPCHCSGDLAREMFRRAYGAGYINVGVGTVVMLE